MPAWRSKRRPNELRRTSDRVEALSTFLVVMLVLMVVPWTTWWSARQMYRDGARAEAWNRQHRFPVVATLLDATSGQQTTTGEGASPPRVPVRATWTAPDGTTRTGTIETAGEHSSGSRLPIWVDQDGTPTAAPAGRSPMVTALVAGLLVATGLIGVLTGGHRVLIWWLNRRRLREWEAEWLVIEPRWTHR
jgi:hypothetical protein